MLGKCNKCGEHCLECKCVDESISCDIQSMIAPIYEKYKDHPSEFVDALQFFLDAISDDIYMRYLEDFKKELIESSKEPIKSSNEIKSGYICRTCAVKLGAFPVKDHICTCHEGICYFCNEKASLCHTSDWNWPNKRCLETTREFQMGTYYAAIDFTTNQKIEPPGKWANKVPCLYHPANPFSGMVVMMNSQGSNFEIIDDCVAQEAFYSDEFKDITNEVYAEYKKVWGGDLDEMGQNL